MNRERYHNRLHELSNSCHSSHVVRQFLSWEADQQDQHPLYVVGRIDEQSVDVGW